MAEEEAAGPAEHRRDCSTANLAPAIVALQRVASGFELVVEDIDPFLSLEKLMFGREPVSRMIIG